MPILTAADIVDRIRRGDNLQRADLRYVALRHVELADGDFEGADLEGARIERVVFRRCNLRGASFSRTLLDAVQFIECDLDQATLSRARGSVHFDRCSLRQARLDAVDLERARFEACQLDEASLDSARLSESTWYQVSARNACLVRADLELAMLRQVDLTGADMTGASLARSSLDQVTFDEADLSRASAMLAKVGQVSLDRTTAPGARWLWIYNADQHLVTRLRGAGAVVTTPVNVQDPLWRIALKARNWLSGPVNAEAERSPVVSKPLVTRGSLLILSLAIVIAAAGAGVLLWRGASIIGERIRWNSGIPVANSELVRIDDHSFMYVERGNINVLRWDGAELTLVKRYRIDYDAGQNLFYLDELLKKAVLRDARP